MHLTHYQFDLVMKECPTSKHFYSLHLPVFTIVSTATLALNYQGAKIHEEMATYYFYRLSLSPLFICFDPSHQYVFIVFNADSAIYISYMVIDFLIQAEILHCLRLPVILILEISQSLCYCLNTVVQLDIVLCSSILCFVFKNSLYFC